jgi:hydrogenase-1 operon protein HyaE
MSSKPLQALVRDFTHVRLETLSDFVEQPGWSLLVVSGDANQRPEAEDLAVVVRELLSSAPAGARLGVVTEADEAVVKARFGLTAVPALLFIRDGRTAAVIQRLQNWAVYRNAILTLWGPRRLEATA